MSEEKKVCPTCQGKGVIEGVCETIQEHAGTNEDLVDDMSCTPDQECPTCKGTGFDG